jgi:hypothetical protein
MKLRLIGGSYNKGYYDLADYGDVAQLINYNGNYDTFIKCKNFVNDVEHYMYVYVGVYSKDILLHDLPIEIQNKTREVISITSKVSTIKGVL